MKLNNQNPIKKLDIEDRNIHHVLLYIFDQLDQLNDEQLNHN